MNYLLYNDVFHKVLKGMDSNTSSLSVLEPELYFLIARFLGNGPCQRAFRALLEELEEFKLLPQRVDWEGNQHFRSYENLVYLNRHIRSDHLLRIVERVGTLLDKDIKPSVPGVKTLLGAGSLSLLRTAEDINKTKWTPTHHIACQHGAPVCPPRNLAIPAVPHVLKAYQMSGVVRHHSVAPTSIFSKFGMHGRKLGHLSAVYCVLFDRTGNYIFTGADDALVKVWSTFNMRLLATLRGHSAEITDMAVSFENTLLASGSCDKVVRVWCLRSKAPAAVLQAHSSMITSVQFCPKPQGEKRYLVSTGNDGCVCFWGYNIDTNIFSPKPVKFVEKSRAGAQMLCSSFSPGGAFLATGNSDHVVRVYFLHALGIEKICELEAHTDKVDSICYSNRLNRFVSGSNDGTARIWRYEKQEWRATVLNMNAKLNSPASANLDLSRTDLKDQVRVTMVSWSTDDAMVMTAASDWTIKIWNAYTGTLLRVLEGHEDDVFVLEPCPTDARILLSAGHDGKMIIWDVYTGAKIKKFFNHIEGQGHGAVFDCKFSPDGHSLAATDSHGHLLLMGFGTNERSKKIPQQVFFHTDYRPLMRDANNFVLDEQTQQPPHLMPPPFLVDIDGNPYPASMQRLVPGRENCNESSLVPQMIVNAHGESEVMGDIDNEARADGAANEAHGSETEEEDIVQGARPRQLSGSRADARPSIDVMIEELQRQQDQRLRQEPGTSSGSGPNGQVMSPPPLASPPTPRSNMQSRIGMRRSGEIEGVRQSLGTVSVRSTKKERDAWKRRVTVGPMDIEVLRMSEEKRLAYSEEEIRKFMSERKKKLLSPYETSTASVLVNKKRGQKTTKTSGRGNQEEDDVPENVETARNRLLTRALYDTEEEEEEEDGTDLDLWESENSSDDYSDWVGDQGSSNLEPPKRRSQRKRRRRRLSSSDDDVLNEVEEEEEEEEETEDSTTEESSEEEDKDKAEKQEPSTSSKRESKGKGGRQKGKPGRKPQAENKQKARRGRPDLNVRPVTELDEKMRPPEWITTVIPRKAPFVPQMGDEVMYFRQGHEQYLQAVVRKKVYQVDVDKNQPWHKIPNLRAHELVKIVGIKWLIKPTRLCCLKLAFIDPSSGRLTGKSFTIKYHDMPDVIDFLVLKQHYDISVERGWKPGVRFRSMIDDQWWLGVIKSQEPLSPDFPDSLYQCFNVHWDNGEFEKLSPWDMEPIDPKRKPAEVGGGVDVTQDEYKALLYVPKKTEWPSCGREAESERLIRGLEVVMQHSIAEPFSAPVDLQRFPTYAYFVSYPIDLSTIKTRLENGFYRRITALQWDVRLIYANASIFNRSGTVIVKNANILTETLLRFIKDHACQDPQPLLSELAHSDLKTGSSDDDSQAGSSGTKAAKQGGPSKKKRRKSGPKPNPDVWLEQSESLLAMLFECEDSEPFRVPVDPSLYPDYEDIVKNPMDLTTVHTKLATGHYGNPVDLCRDIRLIFQNSKLYNTNKRSRIYSMTLRLSALFEAQITEIIKQWKSALRASGRIQKLQRPKQPASPEPSSSWDTLTSSILDPNQPSTSGQSQSSRLTNRDDMMAASGSSTTALSVQTDGHDTGFYEARGSGVKVVGAADIGDDSDATIVENDDKPDDDDDDGDTEICDEDTGANGLLHNSDQSEDDDSDDMYDDDKDNDYRPTSKYRHKPEKSTSKGKSSVRGKNKSTKPLPLRTPSQRLKKSNIFYTSDGNSNEDNMSDLDSGGEAVAHKVPSRVNRSRANNRLHEDSDDSDESESVSPTSMKSRSQRNVTSPRKTGRKRKARNHSFKKHTSDGETPAHRKARGARSKKRRTHSEEEETETESTKKISSSALSRSSRSARSQKKYYNEEDSDEPDNAEDEDVEVDEEENKNNSESEEESSEEIDDDSEDELITWSLNNGPEDSPERRVKKSKYKRLKNRRRHDDEDGDDDSNSDTAVPRKRTRLRAPSPPSRPSSKTARRGRVQKPSPVSRSSGKKSKSSGKDNSTRQTRNRGQQKVTYMEDYSDDEDDDDDEDNDSDEDENSDSGDEEDSSARSVSSRGRVRKMTARAKANLKRQMGLRVGVYAGK